MNKKKVFTKLFNRQHYHRALMTGYLISKANVEKSVKN